MSKFRKGVENLPLKEINKSMPAFVMVYDLSKNDDEEALVLEKQIDYANYEDRKWLGRITFWCLTNHHSVETLSMADAEGAAGKIV